MPNRTQAAPAPAPQREEPASDPGIAVTGPTTAALAGVDKLSRLPTDKLLVLFVCTGFGFLLWEDKRQNAEQSAAQLRAFEDSRETDRKFHESQRDKDRAFFSKEREADRAVISAVGAKLEAIERAVRAKVDRLNQEQQDEEPTTTAPMPKVKEVAP